MGKCGQLLGCARGLIAGGGYATCAPVSVFQLLCPMALDSGAPIITSNDEVSAILAT
jgi:hypothetical protein